MQPNDENLPEENVEVPQPEMTPGAQPPVQSEPAPTTEFPPAEPAAPSIDGFSQPPVSTPPAEPTSPTPPTESVTFQPPVTETGTNPEPFQPAPVVAPEPPKPEGFFGKIKSMFGKK